LTCRCISETSLLSSMATSAAARRAWNDAMKATAGAAALPPALQQASKKRRSDRHKKQDRRAKARKGSLFSNTNDEDHSDRDYRIALWVDALEGIDPLASAAAAPEDDEEYDELEELEDDTQKKRRGSSRNKRESKKQKSNATAMPKRFLPRSLGSILLEEASRAYDDDDVNAALKFIECEARLPDKEQQLPRRKFCPVTGTLALYTEPKSGIPYSSLRALEQIRERPPPWMMTQGGMATYYEAVKSLEDR
jgi:YL1 nuclear protein C-terminal domain